MWVACQSWLDALQICTVTHGRAFLALLRTLDHVLDWIRLSCVCIVFDLRRTGSTATVEFHIRWDAEMMCLSMNFLFQILSYFAGFYLGGSRANDLDTFRRFDVVHSQRTTQV
jgi:hypothetical protein